MTDHPLPASDSNFVTGAGGPAMGPDAVEPYATAALRREHAHLMADLDALRTRCLAPPGSDTERGVVLVEVAAFVLERVRPRAQWEEAILYPAVDRCMGPLDPPYSAPMRYEHTIVGRLLQSLGDGSESGATDSQLRTVAAATLLSLIEAHFEVQEAVLLPILDAAYTAESFQREILEAPEAPARPM